MEIDHAAFLEEAIREAVASVMAGGGPFGALIVQAGTVVSRGANRVTLDSDPTAHAEILAIRGAARALHRHWLSDCSLYCSCEPCPMCLGAVRWARLDTVYYAADRYDADAAEFDDARFHADLANLDGMATPRLHHVPVESRTVPFVAWRAKPDRVPY